MGGTLFIATYTHDYIRICQLELKTCSGSKPAIVVASHLWSVAFTYSITYLQRKLLERGGKN
mgnify:CR=1 FL=1